MSAIFGEFGRGEIDGDFLVGEGEGGVHKSGTDAFLSFGDGLIRHADDVKSGEAAVTVAFNSDEATGVTMRNGRVDFGNHTTDRIANFEKECKRKSDAMRLVRVFDVFFRGSSG